MTVVELGMVGEVVTVVELGEVEGVEEVVELGEELGGVEWRGWKEQR